MYQDQLIEAIAEASATSKEFIQKSLTRSKDVKRGDFALPCFIFAKDWKLSPPECAKKLSSSVRLPSVFEKAEIAGPYLNFFLNRAVYAQETVEDVRRQGKKVGKGSHGKKVILEYSSPNIAKPFHVGHLRGTLIGLALDRIYRHLGYDVTTINHLGDWGTQFGFVWAGCQLWGKPEAPDVDSLVEIYRKATALRKAQDENKVAEGDSEKPNVNEMARAYFIRLEEGDAEAVQFWQWCLDVSVSYLKKMYERLGIHFDSYMGESAYRDKLDAVETTLKQSGILEESKGALGVNLGEKLGFVRVFAEDGRSLYITRDIAAADYRHKTYGADKIIYVVGAPQILHFQQLIGILRGIKHPVADTIVHVPYGHVPGISTRGSTSGEDRISLRALLEDAKERALEAYRTTVQKKPEGVDEEAVAEAVGLGAVYFDYLSRMNIKDFHFNWDTALSFQGDTGPYIQYALARINSIEAKAAESGIKLDGPLDWSLLKDDESYQLVSLLSTFGIALQSSADDYEPYHVAGYVLDLAKTFSGNYKKLRVVGEETTLARTRLALFLAVRDVLYTGLTLIGVPPVDRM